MSALNDNDALTQLLLCVIQQARASFVPCSVDWASRGRAHHQQQQQPQSPVNPLTFLSQMPSGIFEPASSIAQQPLHSYSDRCAWGQPHHSGMPLLPFHNQLKMSNSMPSAAGSLEPGECCEAEYGEPEDAATRAPVRSHVTTSPAPARPSMPITTADLTLPAASSSLPRYVPAMPTGILTAAAKPRGIKERVCIVCWDRTPSWVCVPCGHLAMCGGCSAAVNKRTGMCPVCQQHIRALNEVFFT